MLEEKVWRTLYGRLLQMVDANAVLRYAVDPRWPAPEVFDRPGWKVVDVPTGSFRFEMARLKDMGPAWIGAEEPDAEVAIERVVVEPEVTAEVEFYDAPGEVRTYGLGFNADERVLVRFRGAARSHTQEG